MSAFEPKSPVDFSRLVLWALNSFRARGLRVRGLRVRVREWACQAFRGAIRAYNSQMVNCIAVMFLRDISFGLMGSDPDT